MQTCIWRAHRLVEWDKMPLRYDGSRRASTPIPSRAYHAARDGNSGELRSCPGPSKCHVKAQSSELRTRQLINKHWVGLVQVQVDQWRSKRESPQMGPWVKTLGWPKCSFGLFHKMLPNKCVGQPNSSHFDKSSISKLVDIAGLLVNNQFRDN